jgi:hypothetical protein
MLIFNASEAYVVWFAAGGESPMEVAGDSDDEAAEARAYTPPPPGTPTVSY